MDKRAVLMVSPEPPYPLNGGGAFRIASLLHYFAARGPVDLVLFSESGQPAVLPPGLVRSQMVIPLPIHTKDTLARYLRNARRAINGVPPLVDRLAGHDTRLESMLAGKHYEIGIVEHSWAAPYLRQISRVCEKVVLDLHNIESVLHRRCGETSSGLVAAGQRRFAECSRSLEAEWLPKFSLTLTTSETDAAVARQIAPGSRVAVYPNSLPAAEVPQVEEEPLVVFSGNFEYQPNIDAVEFLMTAIWPEVRKTCPGLRLRLVGRGDKFIRHLIPSAFEVELTGPVESARAEIARAAIVVAPVRAGSGTRIKILEAWAAQRPVIATFLAAEGLNCENNHSIVIVEEPMEFGRAIARLNADPARRAEIALNGRRVFEENYTWPAAWRNLDRLQPPLY